MINLKQFKKTKHYEHGEEKYGPKLESTNGRPDNGGDEYYAFKGDDGKEYLTPKALQAANERYADANIPSGKDEELDNTPNKVWELDNMPNKAVAYYVPNKCDEPLKETNGCTR